MKKRFLWVIVMYLMLACMGCSGETPLEEAPPAMAEDTELPATTRVYQGHIWRIEVTGDTYDVWVINEEQSGRCEPIGDNSCYLLYDAEENGNAWLGVEQNGFRMLYHSDRGFVENDGKVYEVVLNPVDRTYAAYDTEGDDDSVPAMQGSMAEHPETGEVHLLDGQGMVFGVIGSWCCEAYTQAGTNLYRRITLEGMADELELNPAAGTYTTRRCNRICLTYGKQGDVEVVTMDTLRRVSQLRFHDREFVAAYRMLTGSFDGATATLKCGVSNDYVAGRMGEVAWIACGDVWTLTRDTLSEDEMQVRQMQYREGDACFYVDTAGVGRYRSHWRYDWSVLEQVCDGIWRNEDWLIVAVGDKGMMYSGRDAVLLPQTEPDVYASEDGELRIQADGSCQALLRLPDAEYVEDDGERVRLIYTPGQELGMRFEECALVHMRIEEGQLILSLGRDVYTLEDPACVPPQENAAE